MVEAISGQIWAQLMQQQLQLQWLAADLKQWTVAVEIAGDSSGSGVCGQWPAMVAAAAMAGSVLGCAGFG